MKLPRAVRRRGVSALAASMLVVLLSTAAVPAAPVAAAPGGLEFSRDGITWSTTAPAAVFEVAPVLSPGAGHTSTWRIRNGHEGAARIAVAVTGIVWSSSVAADVFLLSAADGRGGGFSELPIGEITDCSGLIPQRVLASGDSIQLAITVSMPAAVSGIHGFDESMGFALAIALVDPIVPEVDGCPAHPEYVPMVPGSPRPAWTNGDRTAAAAEAPVAEPQPTPEPPRAQDGTREGPLEEWISCDLRAFASAVGAPIAACPVAFASDGAATTLLGLLVILAIVWFLLLWRRRQRDEDDETIEGSPA